MFPYHISRQENDIPLYIVLVLLKIWRLLIIPRFAEIKTKRSFLPCGSAKQASLFCSHSLRQFWAYQRGRQCKAFVVEHSLRPTASVQCEGDKAVSCGRKDATRASFPPCWVYYAHQCRRSRHRRVHSCCRSWTNARKDSGHCRWRVNVLRLSSMGRAESEDAASSADILRKLRMTSPPATSSDTITNGSIASGKAESISRLHPPLTTHRKKWHPLR